MAQSFIQQMYEAFKKRNVIMVRNPSTRLYSEVGNVVILSAELMSDAQGLIALDYSAVKLTQIYDIQILTVAPGKTAAEKVDAQLVGKPTTTGLTIQTFKPAVAVLGAIALQVAASATVYVVIRGKV